MRDETKTSALKRLSRMEGQMRGIARMIEDDRYCIETVRQMQAVKAALSSLEAVVLADHLDTCVETALRSENIAERKEKVEELVAVMGGRKK